MGENDDDNDNSANKPSGPVHNPNNKRRIKPPPPQIPPPLTQVLGELENINTNGNDPVSLFLTELNKQDKVSRVENPRKAIQDAYQGMINNGHKHQDFYKQIRHLVVEGVSVREAIKQKIASQIGNYQGNYRPPPPVPVTAPPKKAPLPPPFDPSKHPGLASDVLQAAAKRMEQEFSHLNFARHGSYISVKMNIEKTADDSYKVTATFPGRDKPPQTRIYNSVELINYAYAQKNNTPLPVFQAEQVEVDANMKRAIEVARTPIVVPREIQKFSKKLDKNVQQFIDTNMKDSAKVEALYKKHFDHSKPVKNLTEELKKNPILNAQFKYLLTIEHLVAQRNLSKNDPTNQATILKYLGEKLTQTGALLKGTGYEPPQNTTRAAPISHNHNLQRSRANTLDTVEKLQKPIDDNTAQTNKSPRPGGNRNDN